MSKICTACGQPVQDTDKFCNFCGSSVPQTPPPVQPPVYSAAAPAQPPVIGSSAPQYPPVHGTPARSYPPMAGMSQNDPVVGVGTFFGLNLVFSIPVVGFIVCIIMAFSHSNKNVKNFARSHLVWYAIAAVLLIIVLVFTVIVFGSVEDFMDEVYYYI